jgi:hypothetical protein
VQLTAVPDFGNAIAVLGMEAAAKRRKAARKDREGFIGAFPLA